MATHSYKQLPSSSNSDELSENRSFNLMSSNSFSMEGQAEEPEMGQDALSGGGEGVIVGGGKARGNSHNGSCGDPGSGDVSRRIGAAMDSNTFSGFENMTDSRYDGVVFIQLDENYPTDADIEFRFRVVNKSVSEKPDDKIGLYKVGWKSVSDAIAYKIVADCPIVAGTERLVKFNSNDLPKGEEDYYQFCYVSANNEIYGASGPFRVFKAGIEDMVELKTPRSSEDADEEFVVVRSAQALLQERLQQLSTQNGLLEYTNKSLREELSKAAIESKQLKIDKASLMTMVKERDAQIEVNREEIIRLASEFEKAKVELDKSLHRIENDSNELKKYKTMVEAKDIEKEDLQGSLRQRESENSKMQSQMAHLMSENAALRSELEEMKSMIAAHESNKCLMLEELKSRDSIQKNLQSQIEDFKKQIKSYQESATEQDEQIAEKQRMITMLQNRIGLVDDEKKELQKKIANLENSEVTREEERTRERSSWDERFRNMQEKAERYTRDRLLQTEVKQLMDTAMNSASQMAARAASTAAAAAASATHFGQGMPRPGAAPGFPHCGRRGSSTQQSQRSPDTNATERVQERSQTTASAACDAENLSNDPSSRDDYSNDEAHDSLVTLPCNFCGEDLVCSSRDLSEMREHLEQKHNQKMCPICSMLFDGSLPGANRYFQWHVENHFDSVSYPDPDPPAMIP